MLAINLLLEKIVPRSIVVKSSYFLFQCEQLRGGQLDSDHSK